MEKHEHLLRAATAILSEVAARELPIVLLNKALFYFDLACLRDTGRTVTGHTYVASAMGPAILWCQKRLVAALRHEGAIAQSHCEQMGLVRLVDGFTPTRWPDTDPILVGQVARWSTTLSVNKRADFSHENPGWLLARRQERQPSGAIVPRAIRLGIAMQQLIDDDPWVDG